MAARTRVLATKLTLPPGKPVGCDHTTRFANRWAEEHCVPWRRIRNVVHFFIGLQTGLPTEIAFVESIEPISLDEFAARIRGSTVQKLQALPLEVAAFIAQRIAQLPEGTCVGTNIVDKVGIASKHRELSIYRVIVKG